MSYAASITRRAFVQGSCQIAQTSRRTFLKPSTPLKAELVQDLYLKELRNYKPAPIKPTDAEGHVQKFVAPKAPKSPDDGDIAADLKTYEQQQVEVEGQASGEDARAVEKDWFEEPEDEDAQPSH